MSISSAVVGGMKTVAMQAQGAGRYITAQGSDSTPGMVYPNQVLVGCRYTWNEDGIKNILGVYTVNVTNLGNRTFQPINNGNGFGVSKNDMGSDYNMVDYQCATNSLIVGMAATWWDNLVHIEFYEAPIGDFYTQTKGYGAKTTGGGATNTFAPAPNLVLVGFQYDYNPTGTHAGIKRVMNAYFRDINTPYGSVINDINVQVACIKAGFPVGNQDSMCPAMNDPLHNMNTDTIVDTYCPVHTDDVWCGCYLTPYDIPGIPPQIQMLMGSNPKCWSAACVAHGYQTANLRNNNSACPAINYCPLDITVSGGSAVLGNTFTTSCGASTPKPAPAQSPAATNATATKPATRNTQEMFIVFIMILCIVVGVYMSLGTHTGAGDAQKNIVVLPAPAAIAVF